MSKDIRLVILLAILWLSTAPLQAATSGTTTVRLKDLPVGQVIRIGDATNGLQFVKLGEDQYISASPACVDPVLTYTGAAKNFDYTGGEQTYMAYGGCEYKLEVWGAQGGTYTTNSMRGGYGAYSVGTYRSDGTRQIYINVGGKGGDAAQGCANSTYKSGGYNGGGAAVCVAGGGATHMALVAGVLKNLSAYKDTDSTNVSREILVVAAGGGGGGGPGVGGNGGGIRGLDGSTNSSYSTQGHGGTQTAGGTGGSAAGTFGVGGDDNVQAGAGGGGWYGGGAGTDPGPWPGIGAGGGGSGYIASSNLISSSGITKHMTCYSCTTSSETSTYTISNTCVNATAAADCAKTGNGYARITRLN